MQSLLVDKSINKLNVIILYVDLTKNMKLKLNYFIIPLMVVFVSFAGSFFTSSGMNWYKALSLPSFTPPGAAIGIVWTVIFILTALSAIVFYNKSGRDDKFNLIIFTFLVNGFLNIFWSFLFFGIHFMGVAVFEAVFLGFSVLALIFLIKPMSRFAAFLLLPYFLWVVFATYLTYAVWALN